MAVAAMLLMPVDAIAMPYAMPYAGMKKIRVYEA